MNKQIGWKEIKREKIIDKIVNTFLTVFILGLALGMMLVFLNKCLS